MKIRVLAAVAIGAAVSLLAMPLAVPRAAAVVTQYQICVKGNPTVQCITFGSHGSIAETWNQDPAEFHFINRAAHNGVSWYELTEGNNLCLNWLFSTTYVYWDSCISGDTNELFYDGNAGQLINWAANAYYASNTYLHEHACDSNGFCSLVVTPAFFGGWVFLNQ